MIEKILLLNTVIALIVYHDHKKGGIQFLSHNDHCFQLGYGQAERLSNHAAYPQSDIKGKIQQAFYSSVLRGVF